MFAGLVFLLLCLFTSTSRSEDLSRVLALVRPLVDKNIPSPPMDFESPLTIDSLGSLSEFISVLKVPSLSASDRLAIVSFLVAGGQPTIVRRTLMRNSIKVEDEAYIEGLLMFYEGRIDEARRRLDKIDVFDLPKSIAGQIAYVKVLLGVSPCSNIASAHFKETFLLAPSFVFGDKIAKEYFLRCSKSPDIEMEERVFRKLLLTHGNVPVISAGVSGGGNIASDFLARVFSHSESSRYLFQKLPADIRASTAVKIGQKALLSPDQAKTRALDYALKAASYDAKVENLLRVYRFACCFLISGNDYIGLEQIEIEKLDSQHRQIVEVAKRLRLATGVGHGAANR